MIITIAWRELRSLFLSPLAWVILTVFQLLVAIFFLGGMNRYLQILPSLDAYRDVPGFTELIVSEMYYIIAIILILLVPLLTMRLISEERRNRTLSLLYSAPLSMMEIVLGKYLGVMLFLLIMFAMTTLMPFSLLWGGSLDFGLFLSGLLGLVLLGAAFASLGLYISSLTQNPTIAAIASFGCLLLLWIIDFSGQGITEQGNMLAYLSLLNHYEAFRVGLFDSADAIYFILFIGTFLVLSVRHLDADRKGA